ncbi:MAG: hypothetical protein ACM3XM_16910 [Mycobacterium leprae]
MSQPLSPIAVQTLAEFDRLARAGELWPGFHPERVPLVLHGPESAYYVGHPSPPEKAEPLAPIAGRSLHKGPRTPDLMANTAQPVNGVLCALADLPDDTADPTAYARLLLHECFHAFQEQALAAVERPEFQQMGRYPENDAVNNALAIIENRLLSAALSADSSAAARFLSVRRHRQSHLEPAIATYETAQEYNEGTSTYIQLRAGEPMADLTDRLAQCNVGGKWAAYRRFYFTGAIMATLLDRFAPNWQQRFALGGVTLQALLQEAVGPLPSAAQVLAEADYETLLAAEREREAERHRQVADLMAQLEGGTGCRVEIDVTQAPFCAWDPTNTLVVEPGVKLHTRWGCVLNPDSSIKVEIHGLFLEDRVRQVVIARLPEAPSVTGEAPFRFTAPGMTGEAPRGCMERSANGFHLRLEAN